MAIHSSIVAWRIPGTEERMFISVCFLYICALMGKGDQEEIIKASLCFTLGRDA